MMRALLLCTALLLLADCGIRRPLIAPKDIPAYEEQVRRKRARYEEPIPATPPAPEAPQ